MGFQFDELTHGESGELPHDQYFLETTGPVKLYTVVEAAISIDVTVEQVLLELDSPQEIKLCVRSYHKNPAGAITTTSDPEDMMAAVSMMGSALKTTSVERSYLTLEGHPPTIKLGDKLDIPDRLQRPETGVTIEVPREPRFIYVVALLAYYLGAEVVPGPVPRIITNTGFERELDDPHRGFEGEVERVLKQTFFQDCIVRTEGYYPVNLHE